jgi:acyl-coenzyme A thioesterase PaaI-like protein
LDEAAAYVAYARGEHAATARLTVRYSTPAPLDEPLRVEARLVRATRRLLDVEGTVVTVSGTPIAGAEATLMLLTDHQKRAYGLIGPGTNEEE